MSFGEIRREASRCRRDLHKGTVTRTLARYWDKLGENVALAEGNVWRRREILGMAMANFGLSIAVYTADNVDAADGVQRRILKVTEGYRNEPAGELNDYLTTILTDARSINEYFDRFIGSL